MNEKQQEEEKERSKRPHTQEIVKGIGIRHLLQPSPEYQLRVPRGKGRGTGRAPNEFSKETPAEQKKKTSYMGKHQ